MNHLPLGIAIVVVAVVAVLLIAGGETPAAKTPDPATPSGAGTPGGEAPTPGGHSEPSPPPLDVTVSIDRYEVSDATGAEAIEQVARGLGCQVRFSDAARERLGSSSSVHLELSDVSAATVLNLLTEPHGVVHLVRDGVLWILLEGEDPPGAER